MSSENPKVSVVIPTFNRARELTRSICSVLSQTFTDFELIIVDDCSSDNTETVIKTMKDPRLRYIRLERNVGGSEARNVGLRLAKGEYVAFQDSDDEWLCLKLERSLEELESAPRIGAVFSAFIQVSTSGCKKMPLWGCIGPTRDFYESLLWRNVVGTPTLVARKSALEEVGGFDASMPRYQDWELALRLARITEMKYMDHPLLLSYVTEGSITENQKAHAAALSKIYHKHRDSINQHRHLTAAWLHRLGDADMMTGKRNGRQLFFKAWMKHPFNMRYFAKVLLALPNSPAVYANSISLLRVLRGNR